MNDEEIRELGNRLMPEEIDNIHYILDDSNKVVKVRFGGYIVWQMRNEHRRIVRQEDIGNNRVLSTVFLGINTVSWISSYVPPLVFETALLRNGKCDILARYSTYAGAVAGHEMHKQKYELREDYDNQ